MLLFTCCVVSACELDFVAISCMPSCEKPYEKQAQANYFASSSVLSPMHTCSCCVLHLAVLVSSSRLFSWIGQNYSLLLVCKQRGSHFSWMDDLFTWARDLVCKCVYCKECASSCKRSSVQVQVCAMGRRDRLCVHAGFRPFCYLLASAALCRLVCGARL